MTRLAALTFALMLASGCGRMVKQAQQAVPASATPWQTQDADAAQSPAVLAAEPAEFRDVDFKNFSYPISDGRTIELKNGHWEFYGDAALGNVWFDLKSVDYADVDGDGKKEAVVQLVQVSCGGSCDGGAMLFYFFRETSSRVTLLTTIATGSLGYQECGLKSFLLNGKTLILETFQACRLDGRSVKPVKKPSAREPLSKFGANEYTRFELVFKERKFRVTQREEFPWPKGEVLNYDAAISVKDE